MSFFNNISKDFRKLRGNSEKILCIPAVTLLVFSIINSFSFAFSQEYELKAAFLFNFAKFTEWPEKSFSNESNICIGVLGEDPFGSAIDSLSGKIVKGKKVEVIRYSNVEDIRECHILFVSDSEKKNLKHILGHIKNKNMLTVSDIKKFCDYGGMINLVTVDNKIGFEINLASSKLAGLNISSQLLKLAKRVIE